MMVQSGGRSSRFMLVSQWMSEWPLTDLYISRLILVLACLILGSVD